MGQQQQGQFSLADLEQDTPAGQFSLDDIDAKPGIGSRALSLVGKAANIPGVTVAPEFVRQGARAVSDRITEPSLDTSPLMARLKGFAGGAVEGAAEFANLLDILSFGRGSAMSRGANALLGLRGVGNVAEGVNEGDVAQGARGVAEAAMGAAFGLRSPAPAPRPQVTVGPVPHVSVGPVPGVVPPPAPARPGLPTAQSQLALPPGPPEVAPQGEDSLTQVIELLRNATKQEPIRPRTGFAEPPIVAKPQLPPEVQRIVEAVAGTGIAAPKPAGPARTADIILDQRLLDPPAAPAARDGHFKLNPPKNNSEEAFDAARRAKGIEPSPLEVAERATTKTLDDVATLKGRATLEDRLPAEFRPTVSQMDTLDALGNAYRKAAAKHDAAKLDYTAGKIDADTLQAANITKRQAGKSLRQMEQTLIKEAEAAAKKINREAGFASPQLLQALSGGTIGGLTGASLDEEDPLRGALIGAAAGAVAPGTIIGTAKSVKTEGLKAVGRLYISGLLSGPMTMVRNVTSTAANGLFRAAFHPAAVLIDRAKSPTGARTVTMNDITPAMIATWTGFKRGATDALKTFVTGVSPYSGLFKGAPGGNELAGGLSNAGNWPGRALDSLDTWMGRIIESQAIASRSYVEAVNRGVPLGQRWKMIGTMQGNPSAAVQAGADNEARRVLFRGDPGKLTEAFSQLRNSLNEVVPGKVPIGDWLIPFVRVPAMVVRQASEMTPMGLLQDVSQLDSRARMEHYGRVFAGSLIMLKGAELAIEGRVSGSGPANPQERAKLYETGWRPYSINVPALPAPVALALGGTKAEDGSFWLPTNALGPAGMMFAAVGDMAEGWRDAKDRDDATMESTIVGTLSRLAHTVADQTFLSDAIELGEALDNPSMAQRYWQRKVGSMVPAAARQLARVQDPVMRDPKSGLESIKANLPVLSKTVPARTDRFGDDVRRPQGTEFIAPNPALDVIRNAGASLNKSQGRISVNEPDLRRVLEGAGFAFDDAGVIDLSPEEKRALTTLRGKEIAKILSSLKNSDTYNALPPAARKIIIERIKRRVESERRMPELLQLLRDRKAAPTPGNPR